MGDWCVQIFSAEELKRLSERDLDLIKAQIRNELRHNPKIIDALIEACKTNPNAVFNKLK